MSCANFKNYARNKLFIALEHNSPIDNSDWYDHEELLDWFKNTITELLGDQKDYITMDVGYYSGTSIGINYRALLDIENQKERKALRIKLEKALQKIYDGLIDWFNDKYDITWLGFAGQFSNGETLYDEYKEWQKEI